MAAVLSPLIVVQDVEVGMYSLILYWLEFDEPLSFNLLTHIAVNVCSSCLYKHCLMHVEMCTLQCHAWIKIRQLKISITSTLNWTNSTCCTLIDNFEGNTNLDLSENLLYVSICSISVFSHASATLFFYETLLYKITSIFFPMNNTECCFLLMVLSSNPVFYRLSCFWAVFRRADPSLEFGSD